MQQWMYESFLAQINSDDNVILEQISHSPNCFSPIEQENDYNSRRILAEIPHIETMDLILTQPTTCPLWV